MLIMKSDIFNYKICFLSVLLRDSVNNQVIVLFVNKVTYFRNYEIDLYLLVVQFSVVRFLHAV